MDEGVVTNIRPCLVTGTIKEQLLVWERRGVSEDRFVPIESVMRQPSKGVQSAAGYMDLESRRKMGVKNEDLRINLRQKHWCRHFTLDSPVFSLLSSSDALI